MRTRRDPGLSDRRGSAAGTSVSPAKANEEVQCGASGRIYSGRPRSVSPARRLPTWPRRGEGPRRGRCPLREESAPYVVVTHCRADVGEQIYELAACRDQRDDDDERTEGQDERVLNHALSRLPARGAYHSGC